MNGKTRLPEIQLCVWNVFSEEDLKRGDSQNSPGAPVVKTVLARQAAQVRSLVGELRSRIPHSTANK